MTIKLPKFKNVQFYPGYSYEGRFAAGRYVASGEDGKVYVWAMGGANEWHLLGAPQEGSLEALDD